MIRLIIKQRIILAHIDGMSNRAIANVLHLSKDTVNKYVNEYNEKREECKLRLNGTPVPLLRNGYSIFNGTKYR